MLIEKEAKQFSKLLCPVNRLPVITRLLTEDAALQQLVAQVLVRALIWAGSENLEEEEPLKGQIDLLVPHILNVVVASYIDSVSVWGSALQQDFLELLSVVPNMFATHLSVLLTGLVSIAGDRVRCIHDRRAMALETIVTLFDQSFGKMIKVPSVAELLSQLVSVLFEMLSTADNYESNMPGWLAANPLDEVDDDEPESECAEEILSRLVEAISIL